MLITRIPPKENGLVFQAGEMNVRETHFSWLKKQIAVTRIMISPLWRSSILGNLFFFKYVFATDFFALFLWQIASYYWLSAI